MAQITRTRAFLRIIELEKENKSKELRAAVTIVVDEFAKNGNKFFKRIHTPKSKIITHRDASKKIRIPMSSLRNREKMAIIASLKKVNAE